MDAAAFSFMLTGAGRKRIGSRLAWKHYTRFRVTLMLSRVALEYGHTW